MTRVKIELVKKGMVVAVDVKNMDNMLLIPAGCALSDKHIDILRAWGVTEVRVDSDAGASESSDPMSKLSPAETARLTAEVKNLFWRLDEASGVQMEIFQLVLRRKARRHAGLVKS